MKDSNRQKIFIDVGGHKGVVLEEAMRTRGKSWRFFAFEPNPVLWPFLEKLPLKVEIIKAAAWIYDGEVDFFVSQRSASSTLLKGKLTGKLPYGNPTKYPCLDFGKWVKKNFEMEDKIVVNFNVEGAEYQILKKMIEDRTILYLDHLSVSLHAYKFENPELLL